MAREKKRGRPPGGKNKPGHHAGRPAKKRAAEASEMKSSPDTIIETATGGAALGAVDSSSSSNQAGEKVQVQEPTAANAQEDDRNRIRSFLREMVGRITDEGDEGAQLGQLMQELERNYGSNEQKMNDPNHNSVRKQNSNVQRKDTDQTSKENPEQSEAATRQVESNSANYPESQQQQQQLQQELQQQQQETKAKEDAQLTDMERYFRSIQKRLVEQDLPEEYAKGTFWVEPPSPYFALRQNPLDPTMLYRPRVFLWMPHLLVENRLRCPQCNANLENKGFNKCPPARRVFDIDNCYYIMSMRYRCSNSECGISLNAHDQRVMNQLPHYLAAEFPAYLAHRCAISKDLANLLQPCIRNNMTFDKFRQLLHELHTLRHGKLQLQYLNAVLYRSQPIDASAGPAPAFSEFSDPDGYSGRIPSTAKLRLAYQAIMSLIQPSGSPATIDTSAMTSALEAQEDSDGDGEHSLDD